MSTPAHAYYKHLHTTRPARLLGLALGMIALASPALAQTEDATGNQDRNPDTGRVGIAELLTQTARAEPNRRAGLRADLIRRTQQTVPAVVIVSDPASYLGAIAGWEGPRRYPVLWDDDSRESHENIARFVRAFKPERVLRYEAPGSAPGWPANRDTRAEMITRAAAASLNDQATDWDAALGTLRAQGLISPGIVLTDVDDSAWPAALALSAARLQPIGFIAAPSGINTPLTSAQADLIELSAQSLARATGLAFQEIGDQIDTITLCANTGTKLAFGPGKSDIFATSARVGRFGQDGRGERWANTGQIFGSFQRSTYQAMCAIFLTPDSAFIFDGYNNEAPWNQYDGSRARDHLTAAGFDVQLFDTPGNTPATWTALTARPITGGLIMINTHGTQSIINLQQGRVRATELPLLGTPAITHIVHSFSTANPASAHTIAGSLLGHGVYAMLGSVDEPYLQAFVPTPVVAQRLLGGFSFAAAVRFDDTPVWKLAVLGDPLITLGPPGVRIEDPRIELPGTITDLDDTLQTALAEGDLASGTHLLAIMGRDRDAARLTAAVLDDPDRTISSEQAAAGIPALFRERRFEQVLTAYANLTDAQRLDTVLGDCFWFSARFLSNSSGDRERAARLMQTYQRPDSMLPDAEEAALRLARTSSEAAVVFLESFRPRLSKQWEFDMLDAALDKVRRTGP